VQDAILRWMVVKPGLALSILRLDRHHQRAAKTDAQEEFAWKVHCATSLLWNAGRRESSTSCSPQLPLGGA